MKLSKIQINNPEKTLFEMNLTHHLKKKTTFPYLYIYPESCTEQMLEEEVNKKAIFVKKGIELISLKNIGNNVVVNFKDNTSNHIYDYVIGADGTKAMSEKNFGFNSLVNS